MPNYDGLYELRLYYTSQPAGFQEITHRHTVDVNVFGTPDPGVVFEDIIVKRASGAEVDLQVVTDEYVALLRPLFSTTQTITLAELWHIPEGTTNAQFIAAYSIAEAGTSGNDENPAYQGTLTFRSTGGGTMRLQYMEIPLASQLREPYPTGNAIVNNIFAYVVSSNSPFLARDNTRPFAAMNFSGGQNEALWRKRYRQ